MKLAGFQLLGLASEETAESAWIIPAAVTADHLKDILHYINQAEFSPPTFEEGVLAEHQLKRKSAPRKKAAFDDDEEGEPDDGLFPAGGPTVRKVIDEDARPKKTRKRRRRGSQVEELDEAALKEKRRKRKEKEHEKALRIKSAETIGLGDDEFDSEEDEEFFARERAIASRAAHAAKSATGVTEPVVKKKKKIPKPMLDDSDDEEAEDNDLESARRDTSSPESADETDETDETDDTPPDGSDGEGRKRRRISPGLDILEELEARAADEDVDMGGVEKSSHVDSDDDGDEAPAVARRPRVRGGFVVDSDDDDE